MTARAIPITVNRLGPPVDGHVVSLSNSLEKIASNPDLIAGLFGAFGGFDAFFVLTFGLLNLR